MIPVNAAGQGTALGDSRTSGTDVGDKTSGTGSDPVGILNEARREFIAAPDSAKGQIVYKWPDHNIRKFARAIVEPDAAAVFTSQGQVMGVLPPGQHRLDAAELPFLGMFVDWGSSSNAFKAEIYFVGAREFPSCRFGGRMDEVQDPQTGLIVTLRAFGEYALRVIDPTKLIFNLVGTVDVTNNDAITDWVAQQLLKVTRTDDHHPADDGGLADPRPVHAQPGHRGGGACRPPTTSSRTTGWPSPGSATSTSTWTTTTTPG